MAAQLPDAQLDQVERYRFQATYPGAPFPPLVVDEPEPVGGNQGPAPVRTLATSVGHCMSSTLYNTLQRAHVDVTPIRTTVFVEVGRNERGRLRVRKLNVLLETSPLHEEDRARFDHSVEIFDDFCTVSGAVREGIPIERRVGPAPK
jgi:uncharacterized OsmC-like protein